MLTTFESKRPCLLASSLATPLRHALVRIPHAIERRRDGWSILCLHRRAAFGLPISYFPAAYPVLLSLCFEFGCFVSCFLPMLSDVREVRHLRETVFARRHSRECDWMQSFVHLLFFFKHFMTVMVAFNRYSRQLWKTIFIASFLSPNVFRAQLF